MNRGNNRKTTFDILLFFLQIGMIIKVLGFKWAIIIGVLGIVFSLALSLTLD